MTGYKRVGAALLALACNANATGLTTTIERVGCHVNGDMCFVYVTNTIPTSCPTNDKSLRWDGSVGPNRKEVMSIFLAAQARAASVSFGGVDTCYQGYPSFIWVSSDN